MTNIRMLGGLFLFTILLLGCEKSNEKSDETKNQILKEQLVGKWTEFEWDSRDIYTFSSNDTVYWEPQYGDTILCMPYEIVAENFIQVKRNWDGFTNEPTRHHVHFLSADTIVLEQFLLSFAESLTEFKDLKLARIKL